LVSLGIVTFGSGDGLVFVADLLSSRNEIQSPSGFDRWSWEGLAQGQAVGDFFPDDDAEFDVGFEFYVGVADAAKVEVGTIAYVTLVFIRPLNEALVEILWFHFEPLVERFCFGNRIGNLTFLVSLGIVTFGSGEGDDIW
jgi:hypothetical protein